MSGDVPDPASWVAGATKSELERLLVFLGDAADPGSSATVSRALLIRYVSRAPRRVQAALDDLRTGASPHPTRPLSADERAGVCDEAVLGRQERQLGYIRRLLFVATLAADRTGPAEQRLDAILDALSNALQIELHVYADCEVQRVNLLASVLKRKPIAPLKA